MMVHELWKGELKEHRKQTGFFGIFHY